MDRETPGDSFLLLALKEVGPTIVSLFLGMQSGCLMELLMLFLKIQLPEIYTMLLM
jgi:hypothetical protein